MNATRRIVWLWIISGLLFAGNQARGQVPQSGGTGQANTDLSTPAMKYFGKRMQMPRAPAQQRRQAAPTRPFQLTADKPFQNVNSRPTISPYVSLDAIESSAGLPNYYTRVLPLIQQQQDQQAQATELRRLQQQVRTANAPGSISNNRGGGVPTTGHSSQFLNMGGFFPTAQR